MSIEGGNGMTRHRDGDQGQVIRVLYRLEALVGRRVRFRYGPGMTPPPGEPSERLLQEGTVFQLNAFRRGRLGPSPICVSWDGLTKGHDANTQQARRDLWWVEMDDLELLEGAEEPRTEEP